MYRGYKNRNARLDKLDRSPPAYLSQSKIALANQDFKDIGSEELLHEVHDYLSLKLALLERVIRARKKHHSHFFASTLDYGHQRYLDTLSSQKYLVLRALERLERRTAQVLYEKRKWFKWVRECQDTEEAQRDSEKKKVKQEADLFRRHQKEVRLHMQELKAKEISKRQDAELDKAYYERMSQQEKEEVEEEWDPIEDIIENDRGTYIDLIKHFLFISQPPPNLLEDDSAAPTGEGKPESGASADPETRTTNAVRRSKKAKNKPAELRGTDATSSNDVPGKDVPKKFVHETATEIRRRLMEGVELAQPEGLHMAGTIDTPVETLHRTAPIPEEEINQLLTDLAEIKLLLLCRLILSHAAILPAALRAASVEDLLNDTEVSDTDLRDVCLKMDNPGLQEIRDACADLGRGTEEDEEDNNESADSNDTEKMSSTDLALERLGLPRKLRSSMPEKWSSAREERIRKRGQMPQTIMRSSPDLPKNTMIDFGNVDDEGQFQSRKMRVRICGKDIYNYRSEKAISRGGWLHFSILAKDSGLHKAIELCRNWDEFWELNILSIFQYFPAANWLVWKGDSRRKQLLQLGLVPYYEFGGAEEKSSSHQTGSRGQQFRRAHAMTEYRNFMCCHIKRNDPASRRFCQYLSMESSRVVVLIRDAKTGQILVKPPERPEKQTWLTRNKAGLGRASKNEWQVTAEVGPKFFEVIDNHREWHFSFDEYYDIYVWDLEPGLHISGLYSTIHDTMVKALQACDLKDMWKPAGTILKSIARHPETFRTRDAKDGEETLWDLIQRSKSHFVDTKSQTIAEDQHEDIFYSEADALEDYILFPDGKEENTLFKPNSNAIGKLLGKVPNMMRFIQDLDTDEESGSSDEDDDVSRSITNGQGLQGHQSELDDKEDESSSTSSDNYSHKSDRLSRLRNVEDLTRFEDNDDPSSAEFDVGRLFEGATVEDKQDLAILSGWKLPDRFDQQDPQSEFMRFVDREKATAFKEVWHRADLTPNAEAMYTEARQLTKQMEKFNFSVSPFKWCHDLRFLDVHPNTNRRVVPDIEAARAMMMLFFPSGFLDSKHGKKFKNSHVIKQGERADRGPPKIRSHISNKYRPKSFWTDWDSIRKQKPFAFDLIPRDWDTTIRPIIAKLYKEGVIISTHMPYAPGQAIARVEADGTPDLFLDFRVIQQTISFPPGIEQNPPTKESLLSNARAYAKTHPDACFALLRLWSAPHFYPLMLGLDRRDLISFSDLRGRAWEWNFIPKDMPCSEISMHHAAQGRLRPYKHLLGKNVFVSRNMFLVMGVDEADLLKYAVATTFIIQTEPWRLEVDLWKSFVNVDLEFLQGLAENWMD